MEGKLSGESVDFILKCLEKEQEKRPEISQMLEHSWMVDAPVKHISNEE